MNEIQLLEWQKCKEDIVYFVRMYARTIDGIPLIMTDGLVKLLEYAQKQRLPEESKLQIVEGERISGKTTALTLIALHNSLFFSNRYTHIDCINPSAACHLMEIIKIMYSYLPKWMQQEIIESNRNMIKVYNNNKITTGCGVNHIRGNSFNTLMFDEPSCKREFKELFETAYPAIAFNNQNTKIIVASSREAGSYFNIIANESKNLILLTRDSLRSG